MPERHRIRHSFERHAGEYDDHASIQKIVVDRLSGLVDYYQKTAPACLLDVGCGTGAMLGRLRESWPLARAIGVDLAYDMLQCARQGVADGAQMVQADADNLPFQENSVDLLVSASTLQWLDNPVHAIAEFVRVLKPGGLVCVAFFGGATLCELHRCYQQVLRTDTGENDPRLARLHRFKPVDEFENEVRSLPLEEISLLSEKTIEWRSDLYELLRSIKGVGAGAGSRQGAGGLGWKRVLHDVSEAYREQFGADRGIPATYETIYLIARKV